MTPEERAKVIHERARLAMMSALAARKRLSFSELRELLGLTDGNLSVHAAVLEDYGLIRVKKEFVDKKPRTTFAITDKGEREFARYVEELERMLGQGK